MVINKSDLKMFELNMKRIFALSLMTALLLTGCATNSSEVEVTGSEVVITTETTIEETTISPDLTPSYDELLQNRGEMLRSTYTNRGEVNSEEDYLVSATYVVNYDGNLEITAQFNLSGEVTGEFALTEEEFMNCYILGVNGINSVGTVSDSNLGPDQSSYTYHFNNGNSTQYDFMQGYVAIGGETFIFRDFVDYYTTQIE